MALPTTNLSLNAIHIEVGGTSGTQVSLNDADVRGIGNPSPTYAPSGISQTTFSSISMGLFRGAEDVILVNLSGTSGSPIIHQDGSASGAGVTAISQLIFQSDGDLVQSTGGQPNTAEWYDGTVSGTWYLRVSIDATSENFSPYGGTTSNSGTFNTWLALTTTRTFTVSATNSTVNGATASRNTTFKAEIASDSGGSNIVATGYYRCRTFSASIL